MLTIQKVSQSYNTNINFKSKQINIRPVKMVSKKTAVENLQSNKSMIRKLFDNFINNPLFKLLDKMAGIK